MPGRGRKPLSVAPPSAPKARQAEMPAFLVAQRQFQAAEANLRDMWQEVVQVPGAPLPPVE